jgi:hypothetical protein
MTMEFLGTIPTAEKRITGRNACGRVNVVHPKKTNTDFTGIEAGPPWCEAGANRPS